VSGIKTVDEINAIDSYSLEYAGYVFYNYDESWCVSRISEDDSDIVTESRAFKPKKVTRDDMIKYKRDKSVKDIYDAVEKMGLPYDIPEMSSYVLGFAADDGTEILLSFFMKYNSEGKYLGFHAGTIMFIPDTVDYTGLKYSDVKMILGSEGDQADSDEKIFEWKLYDGKILRVWLKQPLFASTIDDYVVQSFSLESGQK